mgnify:CR=1 FL=1
MKQNLDEVKYMELTMLGTGNAMVTECYNTCFVLSENKECFLVDAGGGNTILHQLKHAGIDWMKIKNIFVTHKHVDHIMGVVWMIRKITTAMHKGVYEGEVNIYAHDEVIKILQTMCEMLLQKKETAWIGKGVHFVEVKDGEKRNVMGHDIQFFDIHSTKAKQFGFTMWYDNKKLTCCGDEPYNECEKKYARNSKWLLHEAFCLYDQADIFHPYEKHHSTAKDASELAEQLGVQNLILYHTEDKNIVRRKELYTEEGKKYFSGNLYVPEDLEKIEL